MDLKWDHSASKILEMSKVAIKMANDTINSLVAAPGKRTYENTVVPLAAFETWMGKKTTPIGFYT
jgi:hypothetical protein